MVNRYAGMLAAVVFGMAAPACAETIDVSDNHGVRYDARWAALAARGVNVRIVGPCHSACTVLLGHIPRSRICVTPNASFGFHLAKRPHATAICGDPINAIVTPGSTGMAA
jgi:hypothetical protein